MRHLGEFLKRIFGLQMCGRCAHPKIVHERNRLLDEMACLSCKMGSSIHPFEEMLNRSERNRK
jgi:hypothetical protein